MVVTWACIKRSVRIVTRKTTMHWQQFFYPANIIDYARVVTLYWACCASGTSFAMWYAISYILDIFDGPAARALNQESKLGYYLDMVIDRISSIVCLHFAANAVLGGDTFIPQAWAFPVAWSLRACLVLVEIISHGVVVYYAEVVGVHQKKMGFDYAVVRLYLGDKRWLFWGCASFEAFAVGLVVNIMPVALISLPGFVFRAIANVTRLVAIFSMDTSSTEQDKDS